MIKPHLSEKAVKDNKEGIYVFEVPVSLNKQAIADMVEKSFNVKVDSVNLMNVRGKTKRFRQSIGQRKSIKKAIIRLIKGNKISGFETEEEKEKKTKKSEKKEK